MGSASTNPPTLHPLMGSLNLTSLSLKPLQRMTMILIPLLPCRLVLQLTQLGHLGDPPRLNHPPVTSMSFAPSLAFSQQSSYKRPLRRPPRGPKCQIVKYLRHTTGPLIPLLTSLDDLRTWAPTPSSQTHLPLMVDKLVPRYMLAVNHVPAMPMA